MGEVRERCYLGLRINSNLKENFYQFCKKRGIKPSLAVRFFVKRLVESGKIPFSLDNEIGKAYNDADDKSVRISLYLTAEERCQFSDACDKYGLPMSIVVRGFMAYCVDNNCFPYDNFLG